MHGAYLLRAKHRMGETYRYMATSVIQGVEVTNSVDERVAKVRKGVATLVIEVGPASMAPVTGKQRTMLGVAKRNLIRVDRLNHPVDSSGVPNVLAQFPEGPVKIGSVWKGLSSFATSLRGGGALATSYRFSGIQKDKGKTIAVLNVLLKGIANGSGAMLIDTSDGSLLASSLVLEVASAPGQVQQIQMRVRRR
jgi:hypothetical protein